MDIEVFVTPGLGDNSFLLVSGDEALVVDPQRDAWRFLESADAKRARVRAVLETHVHNDYVSGAHEIRAAHGAELVLPADGRYEFEHRGAREGEEVRIGDLRVVAWDTPGHTFEHIAWVVYEGESDEPVAVFSGGSLLVGSAGRTDLLGPDHTAALTAHQYDTVKRLGALPAATQLLPTHGAGSFCVSSMPSTSRTSTLGAELRSNDMLLAGSRAEFEQELTGELMAYPAYYAHMASTNRAGVPVLHRVPELGLLDAEEAAAAVERGATVVDARGRDAFAEAHIPGSLNIELNSGFGSYVGWLLPFGAPVVLVLPEEPDAAEQAATQLLRIGWRMPDGVLRGGVESWQASDRDLRSYATASPEDLAAALGSDPSTHVLDVRQPLEWQWGTLPGSQTLFVSDLPGREGEVPTDGPVYIVCSNGHRAAIAASLLDGAGPEPVLVGDGGVGEVLRLLRARESA
ncbi:MBL fold metallo-hydrolase [Phycicoccus sp.]|uniref:MBL fold metallo-hydrolase n=1 Tax=Phycicoccus sp. TaxID=1902410 RepID=UPI002B90A412|nr:MBL fold metallo-hydrolase [Phycicoccus sp.]HMM96106.1 MBL fold metallo-hydrolase [Phycicoccus sp.]